MGGKAHTWVFSHQIIDKSFFFSKCLQYWHLKIYLRMENYKFSYMGNAVIVLDTLINSVFLHENRKFGIIIDWILFSCCFYGCVWMKIDFFLWCLNKVLISETIVRVEVFGMGKGLIFRFIFRLLRRIFFFSLPNYAEYLNVK